MDLARAAGVEQPTTAFVESIEDGGFGKVSLSREQVGARHSMLALHVNGVDLPLDHGYPARVMVQDGPGVHNTKWVRRITFGKVD
jgi:DMSO/TMAO reductase YedYZ molybdopterin-dependent catalytic subunit